MRTFAIIATAGFASAASTPDWINGAGYGCAAYAERWCAHGAFRKGSEWTGGAKYNYPEKNCEVCGKQGGGDSSEWSNGAGFDCAEYEKRWCFAGDFKAGAEWTGGAKYNFPELNCATCGKDSGTHFKGKDSHSWHNAKGYNCASYLKRGWCAGGKAVPGMEWTLGAKYNFPEKNCVICGKDAEFLKGSDMPGFTNNHNHGCGSYKANGWCANGKAVPGMEWTLGAKYNFPELNCMDCGKDNVVGQDILNFQNGAGHGCSSYAKRWCKDGKAIPGQEWTLGAKYHFPEKNCVVCGKDYVAPTAAPVVVKKKVATTTAAPCPQVKCANPAPCSYVPSALLNADGCPMHPCGIRTCKTTQAPTAANCPITCMAFDKDGARINSPSVKTVHHIKTKHTTSNDAGEHGPSTVHADCKKTVGGCQVSKVITHTCAHNQETGVCACTCK